MTKIMVIDDNPEFLSLMEAWLKSEHFEACLCQDSRVAVDRARAEMPSLIILDLLMPNKSDIEVLADLKTSSSTRQIPVVVLTAASKQAEETELLVKRLAEERVSKPFDFDWLFSKIHYYLGDSNNVSRLG